MNTETFIALLVTMLITGIAVGGIIGIISTETPRSIEGTDCFFYTHQVYCLQQ